MADDTPITAPGDFKFGINVVDIGDIRVERGLSYRSPMRCLHHNVVYDEQERRIWCKDCEKGIDAFDFLKKLVEQYNGVRKSMLRREEELREAESFQARMRATKVMDHEWRKRSTVPVCPHCRQGIFPEDVADGIGSMSKEFAQRMREKHQKGKK